MSFNPFNPKITNNSMISPNLSNTVNNTSGVQQSNITNNNILPLNKPTELLNPFSTYNTNNRINTTNAIQNTIGNTQIASNLSLSNPIRAWGYGTTNTTATNLMSFTSSEKLADNNPLSLKYIDLIQNQIMNLDKNDICFPYFYRHGQIICEDMKTKHNCHSLTILPKYSSFSFEELRYFNYMKINNKELISREFFINFYKKQKYFHVEILLKSEYYKNVFTSEEVLELENYFKNYNFNYDKSFDAFGTNYNHVNYALYNLAKQINLRNFQNNSNSSLNTGGYNQYGTISNNINSNLINNINNQLNQNIQNHANILNNNFMNRNFNTNNNLGGSLLPNNNPINNQLQLNPLLPNNSIANNNNIQTGMNQGISNANSDHSFLNNLSVLKSTTREPLQNINPFQTNMTNTANTQNRFLLPNFNPTNNSLISNTTPFPNTNTSLQQNSFNNINNNNNSFFASTNQNNPLSSTFNNPSLNTFNPFPNNNLNINNTSNSPFANLSNMNNQSMAAFPNQIMTLPFGQNQALNPHPNQPELQVCINNNLNLPSLVNNGLNNFNNINNPPQHPFTINNPNNPMDLSFFSNGNILPAQADLTNDRFYIDNKSNPLFNTYLNLNHVDNLRNIYSNFLGNMSIPNSILYDNLNNLKFKNYPIHPRDFLYKLNPENKTILNTNRLTVDFYQEKIEKEFDGNKKEFVKSIIDKNSLKNKNLSFSNTFIDKSSSSLGFSHMGSSHNLGMDPNDEFFLNNNKHFSRREFSDNKMLFDKDPKFKKFYEKQKIKKNLKQYEKAGNIASYNEPLKVPNTFSLKKNIFDGDSFKNIKAKMTAFERSLEDNRKNKDNKIYNKKLNTSSYIAEEDEYPSTGKKQTLNNMEKYNNQFAFHTNNIYNKNLFEANIGAVNNNLMQKEYNKPSNDSNSIKKKKSYNKQLVTAEREDNDNMNNNDNKNNIIINYNNINNNHYLNITSKYREINRFYYIFTEDVDEENKIFEISKYFMDLNTFHNLIVEDKLKFYLVKVVIPDFKTIKKIICYNLTFSNFTYEALLKATVKELKGVPIFVNISENLILENLKNINCNELIISPNEFHKIFKKQNLKNLILKDSKLGEVKYIFFDIMLIFDYDKIISDYHNQIKKSIKNSNNPNHNGISNDNSINISNKASNEKKNLKEKKAVEKINEDNENSNADIKKNLAFDMSNRNFFFQGYVSNNGVLRQNANLKSSIYPYFRKNIYNIRVSPAIEEMLNLPVENLFEIFPLTFENENGKIVYDEPVDVSRVNFDCIKLDYLDFELLKIDELSFSKLNKKCTISLICDQTFSTNEELEEFPEKLYKIYSQRNVELVNFESETNQILMKYKPQDFLNKMKN